MVEEESDVFLTDPGGRLGSDDVDDEPASADIELFLPDDVLEATELVELFLLPVEAPSTVSESRFRLMEGLTASITNEVSFEAGMA